MTLLDLLLHDTVSAIIRVTAEDKIQQVLFAAIGLMDSILTATRIIADTVSCNNKSNSVMIFIIIRPTFFNIIVYNIHTIIIFLKKFYGTKNNGISAFIPDKAGKQLDILS